MKTRINEDQKVTLTVGQLKRLIKEAKFYDDHSGEHNSMSIDYDGQKVFILHTSNDRQVIAADTPMGLYSECAGLDDYRNEEIKEFCQTAFQMKVGEKTPSPFGGTLKRVD